MYYCCRKQQVQSNCEWDPWHLNTQKSVFKCEEIKTEKVSTPLPIKRSREDNNDPQLKDVCLKHPRPKKSSHI